MKFPGQSVERRFIILVESVDSARNALDTWLDKQGFQHSEAESISEAVERFSDFTMRTFPDCVLVGVARIPSNFESFGTVFESYEDSITFLGYQDSKKRRTKAHKVAHDLIEMETIFENEMKNSLALAA